MAQYHGDLLTASRQQFERLDQTWDAVFKTELAKGDDEAVSKHKQVTSAYTRKDLARLLGVSYQGWLSDETINEYLAWVCRHGNIVAGRQRTTGSEEVTERFVALNSYSVTGLFDEESRHYKGPDGMTRTLMKLKCDGEFLMRPEYIFLPIHKYGSHWALGIIIPGERLIAILDSSPRDTEKDAKIIDRMVRFELGSRYDTNDKGEQYEVKNWSLYKYTGPSQTTTNDCGVYVLTSAMCIVMGWGLYYDSKDPDELGYQTDIPNKRRRIAAELISGFNLRLQDAPYLQRGANSIEAVPESSTGSTYPLLWSNAATDMEIKAQNKRSRGHIDQFTRKGSSIELKEVETTTGATTQKTVIVVDLTEDDAQATSNQSRPTPSEPPRGQQGLITPGPQSRQGKSTVLSDPTASNQNKTTVLPTPGPTPGHITRVPVTSVPKASQKKLPAIPIPSRPPINRVVNNVKVVSLSREYKVPPSQLAAEQQDVITGQGKRVQPNEIPTTPKVTTTDSQVTLNHSLGGTTNPNPPNQVRYAIAPSLTPWKTKEEFAAVVNICTDKRILNEVCRIHGWPISSYYSWGEARVSLEAFKARVKLEDEKQRA